MNKQRLAVAIAAGIGMLAVFLPWVSTPLGSANGLNGIDGWITLVLFGVPLGISLMGDRTEPLASNMKLGIIIPPILCALLAIYKIVDFKMGMSDIGGDNPFAEAMMSSISLGIGIYLVILAGIAVPVVYNVVKDDSASME